ncbi:hypothetical protein ES703_117364 [subsurface metagenome]
MIHSFFNLAFQFHSHAIELRFELHHFRVTGLENFAFLLMLVFHPRVFCLEGLNQKVIHKLGQGINIQTLELAVFGLSPDPADLSLSVSPIQVGKLVDHCALCLRQKENLLFLAIPLDFIFF